MPTWTHVAIVSGAVLAGTAAIGALIYLANRRGALKRVTSYFAPADEGFAEASVLYEPKERKILVLGLEGSGKTTWLRHLATASSSDDSAGQSVGTSGRRNSILGPTEGFKVLTISKNDRDYSIWEIGGNPNIRQYWNNFIEDTDLLVFVIDSSSKSRHIEAYDELRNVLSDNRLKGTPLLLVASKQDIDGAISPEEILLDSGLVDLGNKKGGKSRIQIVGVSNKDNGSKEAAYWKMFDMCDL